MICIHAAEPVKAVHVEIHKTGRDDFSPCGNNLGSSTFRKISGDFKDLAVLYRDIHLTVNLLAGIDDRASFDQQITAPVRFLIWDTRHRIRRVEALGGK